METISTTAPVTPSAPDFESIKAKQQAAWSSGDYAIVGTTLQIVGEELCEALDLRSGATVLDVAAGNGNASLAAARRYCAVTSTDYVAALLERGRERAAAERLNIEFRQADVEALPFGDATFDYVVSTFGIMFSPDQERAAAETRRVCKGDGKIGLADWTPDGFIGRLFKVIGTYVPPPAGVKSPALWGTRPRLQELYGATASIACTAKTFTFRYRSAAHFLEVFRTYYGPMHKAFAALEPPGRAQLEADVLSLVGEFDTARDGTMAVPSEYLEAVISV